MLAGKHVKLFVAPKTDKQLNKAFAESYIGQVRGESSKGFVLIIYDSKTAGESGSTPSERQPQLRPQHVKHLIGGVMSSRNVDAIDDGDMYAMFDGGRFGDESALMNAFTDSTGKSVQKHKTKLSIVYSHESLEARKELVRGYMTMKQLETCYLITARAPQLPVVKT